MDNEFDFRKLQLPGKVIADLYTTTIVAIPSKEPVAKKKMTEEKVTETIEHKGGIKYLGGNKKHVTIIVKAEGNAYLPDDELEFLYKITGAVQLNASDIAILNLANTPAALEEIKKQLKPVQVLLFGVEPEAIEMKEQLAAYSPVTIGNIEFLLASPVNELKEETDAAKQLKTRLWKCLKTMFLNK